MKEEGEVQKTIKYLKSLDNCFPIRITPGVYGSRGKSDLIVCYYGLLISIEMKVGYNKPSDLQLRFLRDVQVKGGGLAVPCWSCKEVTEFMECVKKEMEQRNLMVILPLFKEGVIEKVSMSSLRATKLDMVNFRKVESS